MQPSSSHALPKTANSSFDIGEMITITSKLSAILAEENVLLGAMKIRDIGPLQEEKQKLSQRLEAFQRVLAADDTPMRTADPAQRDALLTVTDSLMLTAEETMYRTAIAQDVNKRVMNTIVDALAEKQRLNVYGNQGQQHTGNEVTLSINLNERA